VRPEKKFENSTPNLSVILSTASTTVICRQDVMDHRHPRPTGARRPPEYAHSCPRAEDPKKYCVRLVRC